MITTIIVNLRIEGIHAWKGVIGTEYEKSVGFLQFPHRHMFHIELEKEVQHDDRDIEIIDLKRTIKGFLEEKYGIHDAMGNFISCDFGNMSCEMIARDLLGTFEADMVKVLEDGENGARITRGL